VIPDNYLLKVRGEHLDERSFREAVALLRELEIGKTTSSGRRWPRRCPVTV